MAALKAIRAAHKGADIRRWAKKNKVELCFTPTYGLVGEPDRGALRTLAAVHHRQLQLPQPHRADRVLHAYLRWRNANARHPDVLAAQRLERARIRSEKGIRWGRRPLAQAA